MGKLACAALEKRGRWAEVKKLIAVETGTVSEAANDVVIGAADAAIVWDSNIPQYPGLEMVELPELEGTVAKVGVGVLTFSGDATRALHLARYLAARIAGWAISRTRGSTRSRATLGGAAEVCLLAGAMLRPAIEQTINAFEERGKGSR